MPIVIRDAEPGDVPAMTAIYNALIETTTIEWTDDIHTDDERLAWQQRQQAAGLPVLVAIDDGVVAGWASYGPFRDNERWPGYRFTAEQSIHVDEAWWGRGVGRALIEALLARAAAAGIHVMVAGIDGDNTDSIRFHERLGFEQVGRLREIGRKHDHWLDLVLLQRAAPPPFVPLDFAVPVELATDRFRLEPLGPEHNERDHDAWMSSIDHIRATPGFPNGTWPSAMSADANLADLVRHAADFAARTGFTYSVLDDDDVIGCVYLYPASGDEHDVAASSWVTASRAELDVALWEAVSTWLATSWPFERPLYAPRR